MEPITIEILLNAARSNDDKKWDAAIESIKRYSGDSDELLGVQLFLVDNNYSKQAFIEFCGYFEVKKITPKLTNKLIHIPTWSIVAAASVILVAGLYINNYVHQQSLHIPEVATPIYMSDNQHEHNKAMSLYKKGEYKRAALMFRSIHSDTAKYYEAVCYEMLKYYNLSKENFELIDVTSEFYNKSRIRLAAIYLESGDAKKAESVLHGLTPNDEEEAERLKSIKLRLK
jgi:hypothetical protein